MTSIAVRLAWAVAMAIGSVQVLRFAEDPESWVVRLVLAATALVFETRLWVFPPPYRSGFSRWIRSHLVLHGLPAMLFTLILAGGVGLPVFYTVSLLSTQLIVWATCAVVLTRLLRTRPNDLHWAAYLSAIPIFGWWLVGSVIALALLDESRTHLHVLIGGAATLLHVPWTLWQLRRTMRTSPTVN